MLRKALMASRVVAIVLCIGVAAWWPWDGINLQQYGVHAPDVTQGWLLAPFGWGLNQYVFYAILIQLMPLESVQQLGCERLTPPAHVPEAQMYFGLYLKGIDAAAKALRRYPNNKELQRACIKQAAMSSLFNRYTSAAAGSSGMVELSLAAFKKYKSDAGFQELSFLGCFFDYSPENQKRFKESNGIALVHEIIKAHYNDSWVQFHAFCAYSSGCSGGQLGNADACGSEEGLIETMVQVMKDHRTFRVREEVMQVVKSLARVPKYRHRLVELGIVPQLVQVMQERTDSKTDQSVACKVFFALAFSSGVELGISNWSADADVQTLLAKEGALNVSIKALDLAKSLSLSEGFGGQNAQALKQYNVERSCFSAMAAVAWQHPANQGELVRLGAPARIATVMREKPEDEGMQVAACLALHALSEGNAAGKLAVDDASPPSCVGRLQLS